MNGLLKALRFNQTGGPVSVDVLIGQAQFGQYTVKLYDSSGHNPGDIGTGNNADNLADNFMVPIPPNALADRLLGWVITIGSPVGGAGQLYFARLTVVQDGISLAEGPFDYSGPLDSAKILIGFARFIP